MVRIAEQKLRNLALQTLDEALAEALERPVRRSIGLRFALAYLASSADCEREPFDSYWRCLSLRNDTMRRVSASRSLCAIHLALGLIDTREYAARCVSLPSQTKKGWR